MRQTRFATIIGGRLEVQLNILVLDDNPHRLTFFQQGLKGHKVTVCHHARSAIKALKKYTFDVIFLDHDLNSADNDPEDENTGSEVARYIAEHTIPCGTIILHTENETGRESMETILPDSQSIPYGTLKKIGLRAVLKGAETETPEQGATLLP